MDGHEGGLHLAGLESGELQDAQCQSWAMEGGSPLEDGLAALEVLFPGFWAPALEWGFISVCSWVPTHVSQRGITVMCRRTA